MPLTFADAHPGPLARSGSGDHRYAFLERNLSSYSSASTTSGSSIRGSTSAKETGYVDRQRDLIRRLVLPGVHEKLALAMLASLKHEPATVDIKIKFSTKDLGIDQAMLEAHLPNFLADYNIFAPPSCEFSTEQINIEPAYFSHPSSRSCGRSSSVGSIGSYFGSSELSLSGISEPSSETGLTPDGEGAGGSRLGGLVDTTARFARDKRNQLRQKMTGRQTLTLRNFEINDKPQDYFS